MPIFEIRKKADAVKIFVASIEAESLEEAMKVAVFGSAPVKWEVVGTELFSARTYVPVGHDSREVEDYSISYK